jgi:KipI family sensor histidine kinase inhibitor
MNVEWLPYGDIGRFAEFGSVEATDTAQQAITGRHHDVEVRRGWSSLLVLGAPDAVDRATTGTLDTSASRPMEATPPLVVPVVFDGDDLGAMSEWCAMSTEEVISRFTAPEYRVVMLGFTRAFPYLAGLDPRLHMPRRSTPRAQVPAGSVAVAGAQAGIYPSASPGGWQLLGHTDTVIFDVGSDPPTTLEPGDRVRFRRVGGR